jgi:hypothetical protein
MIGFPFRPSPLFLGLVAMFAVALLYARLAPEFQPVPVAAEDSNR